MEKHKSLNHGSDAIPPSISVIREEIAHGDTKDFKATRPCISNSSSRAGMTKINACLQARRGASLYINLHHFPFQLWEKLRIRNC